MISASFTVGRSPQSDLIVSSLLVSTLQAVIFWTGELWMIRDLHSRNGTFVDQRRISFEHCRLREGSVVAFGNKLEAWMVVSAQPPPEVAAVEVASGQVLLATDGLLTLSAGDQEAGIFLGATGWTCEREHEVRPVVDGDTVDVGSNRWMIRINSRAEAAMTGIMGSELHVSDIDLVIQVSRDEEFVQLAVKVNDRTIDLGARAHNYLLLQLARQRLVDSQGGLPDSECGWVSMAEYAGRGEGPRLNIDVFRIRRQFVSIGVKDGASIIERRQTPAAIRIGTRRLSVIAR